MATRRNLRENPLGSTNVKETPTVKVGFSFVDPKHDDYALFICARMTVQAQCAGNTFLRCILKIMDKNIHNFASIAVRKEKTHSNAFYYLLAWSLFCFFFFLLIALFLYLDKSSVVKDDTQDTSYATSDASQNPNDLLLVNQKGENCNVVSLRLHGTLYTYLPAGWYDDQSMTSFEKDVTSSEGMVSDFQVLKNIDAIKAVLLEVDSGGGSPVAGEEIAGAVSTFNKPVVGLIRSLGASAAYWAVSPATHIIASKNSDVGSIGVTSSYTEKMHKDERFVQISSGKYKDAGNPNKALTEEEKNLFLRDVKIIHTNFIEAVSAYRKIPLEKVKSLADGSTVLGETAKNVGLIDEIGSYEEANNSLENLIHEKPVICAN